MSRYIIYNRFGYPIDLREHTYAGGWKATNYWNNPLNYDGIFSIPHRLSAKEREKRMKNALNLRVKVEDD
jgi:hypothetical protein